MTIKTLSACRLLGVIVIMLLATASSGVRAQMNLAASLEVLQAGVEVLREGTSNWLPVRMEGIVGVGDTIRTDATGRARITFFADGTDTELLPGTEFRIQTFTGTDAQFAITVEILIGQTIQRLNRLLDANSSYNILTPGMGLVARGTEFALRVEENGRSAMLVQEGVVGAVDDDAAAVGDAAVSAAADVPPGFGVRSEVAAPLSDVVRASTFAELDAALDGCPVQITTPDDVSLNVRAAPRLNADLIGYLLAADVAVVFGQLEGENWFRITFADSATGYGWVLASTTRIAEDCPGLRLFAPDFIEGDALNPPLPADAAGE